MSTKGPSFRYGNTKGSNHKGKATNHVGFPWAKAFNKNRLEYHFLKHGAEVGARSAGEYESKAVHFANSVDRKRFKTVVDYRGSTYKYDPARGIYAVISKDGYVITHHKPKSGGFSYYPRKGVKVWIKIVDK